MRLKEKVALVTGGASGIGAASAHLFAKAGASGIVIADVDDDLGRQVVEEIKDDGGQAIYVHLDVTDEQQWIDAIAATLERYGGLDITLNNAGVPSPRNQAAVEDTTLDAWNRTHAVNSTGVFLGTKHSIAPMRAAGGGSSSISPRSTASSAASGPRLPLVQRCSSYVHQSCSVQYAPEKIRCNSVHPGFADTQMTAEIHGDPVQWKIRVDKTPLGRMGTAEDIAWGCVFLASTNPLHDRCELVIDGGMTAQ
ncbi:MAG: cyclopentanol dehydrogenase [Pseudomonadota bacterium]|nr:MAG: cyclopentanol dehydrogenase [Pseudomonadota bacterium]